MNSIPCFWTISSKKEAERGAKTLSKAVYIQRHSCFAQVFFSARVSKRFKLSYCKFLSADSRIQARIPRKFAQDLAQDFVKAGSQIKAWPTGQISIPPNSRKFANIPSKVRVRKNRKFGALSTVLHEGNIAQGSHGLRYCAR